MKGGIATPFIVHWPRGIKEKGGLRHNPSQLPDIMATIVDVTGATYPKEYNGNTHPALRGRKSGAIVCFGLWRSRSPVLGA